MSECESTELRAWRAFQQAQVTAVERIEAELELHGLPAVISWYDVLYALRAAPDGRLRLRELAPQVVIKRSWLSRVVDKLEDEGLVRRESCPTDRRGAFVVMTDAGAALLARVQPVYAAAVHEHFGRHVPDIGALHEMLGAVTAPPPERG